MSRPYKITAAQTDTFVPPDHYGCQARLLLTRDTVGIEHGAVMRSEFEVGGYADAHTHTFEQSYYILKGQALITIEDESFAVEAGDAVYFPAGKLHGLKNTGDSELWLVAVNTPQP